MPMRETCASGVHTRTSHTKDARGQRVNRPDDIRRCHPEPLAGSTRGSTEPQNCQHPLPELYTTLRNSPGLAPDGRPLGQQDSVSRGAYGLLMADGLRAADTLGKPAGQLRSIGEPEFCQNPLHVKIGSTGSDH